MSMRMDRDPFVTLTRLLESPSHTPGSIRRACAVVEECLSAHRDNLRTFFDRCFPLLLKRIFGYDDHWPDSWLNLVAKGGREDDAQALVQLLSPRGRLFNAIISADSDQLIKFIFPSERLPAHTQELLKTKSGRQLVSQWPQYAGHLHTEPGGRPQVYLNVFEYYMFWAAYYVLRGRSLNEQRSSAGGGGSSSPGGINWGRLHMSEFSNLRNVTNLIPGLHSQTGRPLSMHPYYTLLRLYLEQFLPRGDSAAARSGTSTSSSSLLSTTGGGGTYGSGLPGDVLTAMMTAPEGSRPGVLLLSILVEFWLTDVAEPVPADVEKMPAGQAVPSTTAGLTGASASSAPPLGSTTGLGGGLSSPGGSAAGGGPGPTGSFVERQSASAAVVGGAAGEGGALRALSYQPPSEELMEALTLLTRYIYVTEGRNSEGRWVVVPAQGKHPWLPETPVRTTISIAPGRLAATMPPVLAHSAEGYPAVQTYARRLYRYLRRALAQWPLASSVSLIPLIHLWLAVITPWARPPSSKVIPTGSTSTGSGAGTTSSSGQGQRSPAGDTGRAQQTQQGPAYTSAWRPHVLSHLPFYTILIPKFLELIYARLSFRGDAAAAELLVLMRALAQAGPDLLKELEAVEGAYNRYLSSQSRRAEGSHADLVPWLADQAAEFEAAAVAGVSTTPPMHVDPRYQLFSTGTSGAPHYAAAILQAAHAQVRPDLRDALTESVLKVLPVSAACSGAAGGDKAPAGDTADLQRFPRAGTWSSVHYKGDWLQRPITSNEIPLLARALVWLSLRLNHALGLDVTWKGEEAEEPAENVLQELQRWMRKRGHRLSLRPLAEVQTLAWLIGVAFLAAWVRRLVS